VRRASTYLLCFILISSSMFSKKLKEGDYRGVLVLNEETGIELPFNFKIEYKGKRPQIIIRNGDERIVVDEISIRGDSVNFKMPVFDTEFRTVLVGDNLEGVWINHYRTSKNIMKFKATFGEYRRFLIVPGKTDPVFEGRWEVTFSPGTIESSKAIGVFHHQEQTDYVTGTFLTETGDYRYLEGMKNRHELLLSSFDGSHAYLFSAELRGENLVGQFYSGAHWHEEWTARQNPDFKLANAEEITFVKNKEEKINFTFPDLNGKQVSLSDKKFENKPVIIQVMGSWCSNCMDESTYLSGVYKQYKKEGLEIVALAFEKTNDSERAKKQVLRLKERLKIDYDILITGQTGRDKASEAFQTLNKISSFPTTIFLNKQHEVIKIHTGFSGPATGKEYEAFKEKTEGLIKNLLKA
jgi:thiol-disulfide isomerase/thioredoxin